MSVSPLRHNVAMQYPCRQGQVHPETVYWDCNLNIYIYKLNALALLHNSILRSQILDAGRRMLGNRFRPIDKLCSANHCSAFDTLIGFNWATLDMLRSV